MLGLSIVYFESASRISDSTAISGSTNWPPFFFKTYFAEGKIQMQINSAGVEYKSSNYADSNIFRWYHICTSHEPREQAVFFVHMLSTFINKCVCTTGPDPSLLLETLFIMASNRCNPRQCWHPVILLTKTLVYGECTSSLYLLFNPIDIWIRL